MPSSPFTLLGVALALGGAALAFTSYFILDFTPLTALGLSAIILAAISFALGREQPKIPPDVSSLLLESGLENTAALIEELGLVSKAVYLPPSLTSGKSRALIPVAPVALPQIQLQLPDRLIVRYGKEPGAMGILVSTLGSAVVERHAQELTGVDLEDALSSTMTGLTDLADGLKVVRDGGSIIVGITNPRLECRWMKIFDNTGSPLASIVASVASKSMGTPITILREDVKGKMHTVVLNAGLSGESDQAKERKGNKA
jgi:hypothetical protein